MTSAATTYDYLVVGAGIAGLTAAHELRAAGKSVLVIEQNNAVGGRMGTKHLLDAPLDIGAQFLAPFYEHLLQLAEEFDLGAVPIHMAGVAIKSKGQYYRLNPNRPLSLWMYPDLSRSSKLRLLYSLSSRLWHSRRLDLNNLHTLTPLDDMSVFNDMAPVCGDECFEKLLDPMCTALFCYDSKNFSRALFWAMLPKLRYMRLLTFDGGIDKLCQKLAQNLELRLSHQALSIRQESGKVMTLARKDHREVTIMSRRVILAIPGNRVLEVLVDPSQSELEFFSKITYSRSASVYCRAKTRLFNSISTIWFPLRECRYFSSASVNWHRPKEDDFTFFSVTIRDEALDDLMSVNHLHSSQLASTIMDQLGAIADLEILDINVWPSALPIFASGYLRRLERFQLAQSNNQLIYFCGDYMENPSTEGALTSGLKLSRKLLSS